MMDLEAILEAIDALPKNDLDKVRQRINQLTISPDLQHRDFDVENWIGNLHMDFLIAALATRLDAILVSADTDFDALPIKREDWRIATS